MAVFKVKLKGRQEIASGTVAFRFEKPAEFSYKAGQFGDFTLANPPETDAEGNTRRVLPRQRPTPGRPHGGDADAGHRLTKAMLTKSVNDLNLPIFYITGPGRWWPRCGISR